ncbi:MAG: hypothetical protein V3W41_06030 [Planctomycetota bacterium]
MTPKPSQAPEENPDLELLERRLVERKRDMEELERQLETAESELRSTTSREPRLDSETLASPSPELEPQFRAYLGGVDRSALETLLSRHHNLDQALTHLRIQVDNLHRKVDGMTAASLGALQRLEVRAERRDYERVLQGRKTWRLVAMALGLGFFILAWYALALN